MLDECKECAVKHRKIESFEEEVSRLNRAILSARGTLLMIEIKEGHPLYEQIDKAYHTLAVAQI